MKKKSGRTDKTLVQITEKDGNIWTQTFDAAGQITSSFISDSVTEALQKTRILLNSENPDPKKPAQKEPRPKVDYPLSDTFAEELMDMDKAIWLGMRIRSGCEMHKARNWDRYVEKVENRMVSANMIDQQTLDVLEDQNYHCLVEAIMELQKKIKKYKHGIWTVYEVVDGTGKKFRLADIVCGSADEAIKQLLETNPEYKGKALTAAIER